MPIKIYDVTEDQVIKSAYSIGQCDYQYALDNLVPLIGRYEEQRKKQSAKFYARLKSDIIRGCVMPPITLAFVSEKGAKLSKLDDVRKFVNDNIGSGYILDGMQRLNTLVSASTEEGFPSERILHINIIITGKYDFLLYRMITLNNGQKPMTPRHQIEILAENLLESVNLNNIVVQTERETEQTLIHGAFKLFDVSAAYTAFLTNNVNNQNSKIIDSKMNEILVDRVMSSDISEIPTEFSNVIELVDKFSTNEAAKKWLKIQNNLIGFTVGTKNSVDIVSSLSANDFAIQAEKFDKAFESINPSKVNVGRFRRELSQHFFEKIGDYLNQSADEVSAVFFDITMSD